MVIVGAAPAPRVARIADESDRAGQTVVAYPESEPNTREGVRGEAAL